MGLGANKQRDYIIYLLLCERVARVLRGGAGRCHEHVSYRLHTSNLGVKLLELLSIRLTAGYPDANIKSSFNICLFAT